LPIFLYTGVIFLDCHDYTPSQKLRRDATRLKRLIKLLAVRPGY
jgi:hypothetical protein